MSIYLYWGEDEFSMARAVDALRQSTLDPNWISFNFDKILPDQSDALFTGLNQAMTPPFGFGNRLVWLVDTTVTQHCPPDLLAELERTIPAIPSATVLLFTARNKPDARLKSTKLLQKCADQVREFSLIPPWKTEDLEKQVRQIATELKVKLTPSAVKLVAECAGNNTRLLYSELEKLQLFAGTQNQPLAPADVAALLRSTTQNSLQLAMSIRQGNTAKALELVAGLMCHNEPALKIAATLTGQFRTWLWVKLMVEAGEADDQIAQAAEIGNPKRVYFLKQEVKGIELRQLQQTLPKLLELEASLKRGAQEISALQTKVIELCYLFR